VGLWLKSLKILSSLPPTKAGQEEDDLSSSYRQALRACIFRFAEDDEPGFSLRSPQPQ
jgi:hypothetical protein